jgi:hypothetical protein
LRKANLEQQLAVEKERAARLRLEERRGPRHIGACRATLIMSPYGLVRNVP